MKAIPQILGRPLSLPCGAEIKNRFAKAAMSETLGTVDNRVTPELSVLFGRWADGGSGLLITGNVMVDRRHLGEPNNVALEDNRDGDRLRAWSSAGTSNGTHLWIQLNHPGRQAPKIITPEPVAPSAVPLGREFRAFFAPPRALSEAEIADIVRRFGNSARLAMQHGFTGVQIHGAHGYLVSQFLSPLTNRRTDRYGGDLEGRMRFAVEIYESIRGATGPGFPVSIKLNSADFQRGGFTEEESMIVAERFSSMGMDLIEISGGTYEAPEMTGAVARDSTRQREAYFLQFAEAVRRRVKAPVMLTGGFRSARVMAEAVKTGATDLIGLARPLVLEPDLPVRILRGETVVSPVRPLTTGIGAVDRMAFMETAWYARQIRRMGKGLDPKKIPPPLLALGGVLMSFAARGLSSRRVRARS
jgi:2,4-dienoyl-CoA reductase-like NADH-dependent reductase (Old Yellow Enzyme family)